VPAEEASPRTGRLIAAVAFAAAPMPLNSTMIAVALPDAARDLHADAATVTQALVSSYLVTSIVLQSPGGKLGDRIGHGRALALGQLLLALGAVVGFLGPNLGALAFARVLMAAGGAMLVPAGAALLRSEVPLDRRGRAFGAFGAVMSLSAGIGPIVGGELVRHFGWRAIFAANVPLLVLGAALAFLPPSVVAPKKHAAPATPARFDFVGTALLAVALATLILGLKSRSPALIGAGAVALVPFALWERRVTDPVVDFSLFRIPAFAAGTVFIALQNLAMYALLFHLPHLLEALFSLDARGVGRLLVWLMGAMVLMSPLSGRLSDRFGAKKIALAGATLGAAAMTSLVLVPLTSPRVLIPSLVCLGAGLGLSTAPAQAASLTAVPKEKSGMAAGLSSTMRYLGGIAGVTVLSYFLTETTDVAVVMAQHHGAVVVFAGALVVSALVALVLPGGRTQAARA
jgi:EmrB/QacA subfamily drug resistance transporter